MYRRIQIQRIIFLATIVIVALGIGLFLYITLSNAFDQPQQSQQQPSAAINTTQEFTLGTNKGHADKTACESAGYYRLYNVVRF